MYAWGVAEWREPTVVSGPVHRQMKRAQGKEGGWGRAMLLITCAHVDNARVQKLPWAVMTSRPRARSASDGKAQPERRLAIAMFTIGKLYVSSQ